MLWHRSCRRQGSSTVMCISTRALVVFLAMLRLADAFMLIPSQVQFTRICKTTNAFNKGNQKLYALPDTSSMKVSEIKKELESYGVSTKTFLEKKEMMEALESARAEGKSPASKKESSKANTKSARSDGGSSTKNNDGSRNNQSSPDESKTSAASDQMTREGRLKEEIIKAKGMKVGELKQSLEARGIKTKTFFEKSEFVKAYAEAVVDGVKASSTGDSTTQDEPYDPEYRDVVMKKITRADPFLLQGKTIDVTK